MWYRSDLKLIVVILYIPLDIAFGMEVVGFCVRPLSLRSNADLSTEPGLREVAPPLPILTSDRPTGQPTRTTKSVAMAKRTIARSHSQPNVLKSGSVSAYAQGGAGLFVTCHSRAKESSVSPRHTRSTHVARRASAKSKAKASMARGCPRTGQRHVLLGRQRTEYIATHVKVHRRNTGGGVSS